MSAQTFDKWLTNYIIYNCSSFNQSLVKGGNQETVFMSNAYNNQLLEGFNKLRSQVLLCDVTLISGNIRFPVHRALLAACSPYFCEMFTKDNQNGEYDFAWKKLFMLLNKIVLKLLLKAVWVCVLLRKTIIFFPWLGLNSKKENKSNE